MNALPPIKRFPPKHEQCAVVSTRCLAEDARESITQLISPASPATQPEKVRIPKRGNVVSDITIPFFKSILVRLKRRTRRQSQRGDLG